MRKSGRTFRKVLGALIKASEGKYVVYISDTPQHKEMATLLAENCIKWNHHSQIKDNQIAFEGPSGGLIEFFTKDQYNDKDQTGYFRNREHPEVVYDTH